LLELRRESQAQGKSLTMQALPARLQDLATAYGIAELMSPA
jgi:ABC-type transporter Mla MlaB component